MKRILSLWILFLLTVASAEAAKKPREFYLTQDTFNGAEAMTACADGYHMASLWEIFEFTNLKYNTELGFTTNDSGSGPPANVGWCRTGFFDFVNGIPGSANCHAWTSAQFIDFGTLVRLKSNWGSNSPAGPIDPWIGFISDCGTPNRVWCVKD